MRSDIEIQTEKGLVTIPKWTPDEPAPPPGVVVLFSTKPPEAIDHVTAHLIQSGYVAAQIQPSRDTAGTLHAQYAELKNRYLAVPFFAVGFPNTRALVTRYCRDYPDDFQGMIWLNQEFLSAPSHVEEEESLFERIGDFFGHEERKEVPLQETPEGEDGEDGILERIGDWIGIEIGDEQTAIRKLPKIPLAILTNDLPDAAETLAEITQTEEITLHLAPLMEGDEEFAWFTRTLIRQLNTWYADRIERLEKTKRGALRWDREKE